MASTINADDGIVSGSAGVKTSADNSGVLELQSNGTTQFTLGSSSVVINEAGADVDFRVEGDTDSNLLFVDASTDRIGVGTNTPSVKVDIAGGINLQASSTFPTTGLFLRSADNQLKVIAGSAGISFAAASGASTYATIDSSGILGLGVTPSAWSGLTAFELSAAGSQNFAMYGGGILRNAYYNGTNFIYKASAAATLYEHSAGQHRFYNAPSGTAGNTITFTQAMTLDADGDLGIGTTSPGFKLDVQGTTPAIRLKTAGVGTGFKIEQSNATGDVELNVIDGYSLLFKTTNAERARITDGGVLCVGTTATNSADKLSVYSTTIGNANVGLVTIRSGKTADTSDCVLSLIKFSNDATTSQIFVKFGSDNYNSGQGQINANGSGQAAFGSFSDRRLKENIVDLESQWQNVKALRPVEFDYIASEGGGHQLGFIAQEVKEVYPDLVGERQDGMLTLSGMGKGEARLIKALQEAMTRIEELEAKVAALESK